MRITLKDNQTGKTVDIDGAGAAIGRDAARCRIVVTDKSVSNYHAKIYAKDGHWYLEDQGSSNGTYVAGKQGKAADLVWLTTLERKPMLDGVVKTSGKDWKKILADLNRELAALKSKGVAAQVMKDGNLQ